MTVTVLPIFETEFKLQCSLSKVVNDRLEKAAKELQSVHFQHSVAGDFPLKTWLYTSVTPPNTKSVTAL